MIFDDRHLHIDEQDPIADWLARSISAAKTGTIKLDIDGQPAVKIDLINNEHKIIVDLLQPALFKTPEDETGLFDKLKTARNLLISLLTTV